jgi:hypothetical protein
MSSATQRFMSFSQGENDANKQKLLFNNSIILHCALAVVVFFLLELVAYPLFHGILIIPSERIKAAHYIYQFLILNSVITFVTVPYDAAINAHEDLNYYAIVGIVESLLKLAIALYMVNAVTDKLILYGYLMVLISILTLIMKYVYCRFNYYECVLQLRKYYHKPTASCMLSFSGWNLVKTTGSMIGLNGGEVVMNHFFGPSVNAAGSISLQLRGQMMALSNGMLKALNPVIIKKEGGGDRYGMLSFAISGAKFSYVLFAIVALPFLLETSYILNIWLKEVPDWAICFSRLQAAIGLVVQIHVTLVTVLNASGIIKYYSIYSAIMHILPLFIYIVLYKLGADPYWTYLIVFLNYAFFLESYLIYQCHIHCGLDTYQYICRTILPAILCSLLAMGLGYIVRYFMEENMLRLVFVTLVVDSVFLISTYYLLSNEKERFFICNLVMQFYTKPNKR